MPVLYAVLCGEYDVPRRAPQTPEGWRCYYFTDLPPAWVEGLGWIHVPLDPSAGRTASLVNRWYKTHPHLLFPSDECSVYVDANVEVRDVSHFESVLSGGALISAARYRARRCAYDEGAHVVRKGADTPRNVTAMMDLLRSDGYPAARGMHWNNVMARRHRDERVVRAMEEWWRHISERSHRDQLSFDYVAWKLGLDVRPLFSDCPRHRCVTVHPHVKGLERASRIKEKTIGFRKK